LNRELDHIVVTDEKVREELNRKPRVEYIKDKNHSELQRSIEKVRTSTSPTRRTTSPYSSMYKSSYKSPYKSPY
jgi:hypothetical protein